MISPKPSTLSIVMLLFFLGAPSVLAQSSEGRDLVTEVRKKTKALEAYQAQRRQVLSQLFDIQQSMKVTARKKTVLTGTFHRLRLEMEDVSTELVSLRSDLDDLRRKVSKSARILHRMDATKMVRFLFSSHSPAQLDRSIKFLGVMIRQEMAVLKSYQAQVQAVRAQHEQLETKLAEMQIQEHEIAKIEEKLKEEHARKMSMVDQFEDRRRNEIHTLRRLRLKSMTQIANQLDKDEEIEKFLRPSFIEQQGLLNWPIEGTLKGEFGLVRDRELQTDLSLTGWFIAKISKPEVRVPFEGTVMFTHSDEKLRNVVIVDHGHEYYTSYSNLEKVTVNPGQQVQKGEILGVVGYSPRWQTEGLHFEIRHFLEAQDPHRWMISKESFKTQAKLHQ